MTLLQYYKKSGKKYRSICFTVLIVSIQHVFSQAPAFHFVLNNKCAPAIVTFYNDSEILPGHTYMWNFGKGGVVFSTDKQLSEVYSAVGTYNVSLSIIDGTDTSKTQKTFSLVNGPTASFNIDTIQGCAPLHALFTDASTKGNGTITSYFWDFNTGQTSTTNPANYIYNIPGTYDVFYRITDNNGCSSYYETKQLIRVFPIPVVNFSASETFACEPPLFVDFENLSTGTGTLTNTWNFGNGETDNSLDASTIYATPGTFDVRLEVEDNNGCSNSLTKQEYIQIGKPSGEIVAINNNDTINENNATLCPGLIKFASTLPGQSDYKWTVNYKNTTQVYTNQNSIILDLQDSGRVDIKLKYGTSGYCPDSITKTFYIDYVNADFTLNKEYSCQLPFSVQLQNQSENAVSYTWTLPNQLNINTVNASFIIPSVNTYEQTYTHRLLNHSYTFILKAVNSNGCSDTTSKVFSSTPPIARFMPDTVSGCIPLTVTLADSSKSNEDIVNWKYIIGSETITQSDNTPVTYTFNSVGEHKIYLIITNDSGCTDTSYYVKIKAGNSIEPDFSVEPSDLCYGDSLYLTFNGSLPQNGASLKYSSPTLFSTGEISSVDTAIVFRPDTIGQFPVRLDIDYFGCKSDSVINNAFEILGPVGSFYEKFDCDTPLAYTFYSDIQGATNLEWIIDGNTFTNVDSVKYIFPESGDYLVTLNAFNSTTGCNIQKNKIINVRQVSAEIEVKPVACLYELVGFSSSKSKDYIDECYKEGFLWYWDDKTPERRTYDTLYTHVYADTGTYHPVLEVTADNGCKAYDTVEIRIVSPMPEISATPSVGCGPELDVQLNFINSNSEIDSWSWIFGDNTNETNSGNLQTEHTYFSTVNTTYYAGLLVTDIYGCQNYDFTPITLSVINSDFQASRHGICSGDVVYFTFAETGIDSFLFDFGDGNQSTNSISHQYNSIGTYNVSLSIWKDGCFSKTTKSNWVIVDEASANYSVSSETSTCYPVTITFNHTNPASNIASGIWDFGDETNSGTYSPVVQHTYSSPGTYQSKLIVRTLYNCISQVTKDIVISGPDAEFSFFPAIICSGDSVTFHLNSISNTDEYQWYFGDGNTSTEENPTHQYYAKGMLSPAIWLKKGDCEVTLPGGNLYVSLVDAGFSFSKTDGEYCYGEQLTAINNSISYYQSLWSIDGNQVSANQNLIEYQFNSPGLHELELIVADVGQCFDTIEKPFVINALPVYAIEGDTLICEGSTANLNIPDFNPLWTVDWTPANIMSDPDSPITQASPDTTSQIRATVYDTSGCSSTNTFLIRVKNDFSLNRFPLSDTSIFLGEDIGLLVTSTNNDLTYDWNPKDWISCNDCPNPVVNPAETTTYIVTTTDGCTEVTAEFLIEVIIDHYLEFPTAFTPNSDNENDIFRYEAQNIAEVEFKIFNRWGNLIFSTNSLNEGWDGQYNGKIQNIDSYSFYIKATTVHGFRFEKKGTFMLLK